MLVFRGVSFSASKRLNHLWLVYYAFGTPQTARLLIKYKHEGIDAKWSPTVDGRNPAPLGMYKTLQIMG